MGWKDGRTRFQSKDALRELRNRGEVRFTESMPDEGVRLPGTGAEGAGKGSFRIRRAKTELTGWLWRPELTYELQLSWAGPEPGASTDTPLEDLVLNWDFSGKRTGRVTFGQFKVPLGRQEYTSSNRLQFCDRDILSFEFSRGRELLIKHAYRVESSPLYGCWPSGFVHDEYLVNAPRDQAERALPEVDRLMIEGMRRYIPDVKIKAPGKVLYERWGK